MTTKDVLRSQVMAQVMEGKLDQASAAARLGISVRQVKRLKRRLLDDGVQGLLSKKRGRPSNRRTPAAVLEGDGPDQGALRGFWPDAGMGTAPVGQPELPIQRLALPSGGRRSGPQLARLGGDDRDSPGQRTRNSVERTRVDLHVPQQTGQTAGTCRWQGGQ